MANTCGHHLVSRGSQRNGNRKELQPLTYLSLTVGFCVSEAPLRVWGARPPSPKSSSALHTKGTEPSAPHPNATGAPMEPKEVHLFQKSETNSKYPVTWK